MTFNFWLWVVDYEAYGRKKIRGHQICFVRVERNLSAKLLLRKSFFSTLSDVSKHFWDFWQENFDIIVNPSFYVSGRKFWGKNFEKMLIQTIFQFWERSFKNFPGSFQQSRQSCNQPIRMMNYRIFFERFCFSGFLALRVFFGLWEKSFKQVLQRCISLAQKAFFGWNFSLKCALHIHAFQAINFAGVLREPVGRKVKTESCVSTIPCWRHKLRSFHQLLHFWTISKSFSDFWLPSFGWDDKLPSTAAEMFSEGERFFPSISDF